MDGAEEELGFDCLSTVKVLLGITDTDKDAVLSVYIDMTRQEILNYCNRSDLPEALNYTLCRMTADAYRDITAAQSTGEVKGNVSSISEDGRSVSFSSGAEFKTSITDRVTRITELNRYKKLYRLPPKEEADD